MPTVQKYSRIFVFLGTRELNEFIGDDGSDGDISIGNNDDDDNDFRVAENVEPNVETSLFVEESNFFVNEGELQQKSCQVTIFVALWQRESD